MTIQNIRGTCDILPETSYIWEWMEEKARGVFANFHFKEIRTPIFEATELFSRSIGDTSDIVSKEMYTFADKKGRSITLRPEGTASVVRACIQHKLIQPGTVNKLFYIGPMFRYERPQAGRQRQFHQIGIEIINAGGFLADVEAILLLRNLFEAFGINDLKIRINTTCSRAFKPELNALLREKIKPHVSKLCPDCQERYEKNVLRIYDCKIPSCKEIIALFPKFRELLNKEDLEYFEKVKQGLELLGINYEVDDFLVRGLDYYTRTIFEIYSEKLGACDAIAGGGRYDSLFKELGSAEDIPSVGFAIGMERFIQVLGALGKLPLEKKADIFVVSPEPSNFMDNLKIINSLRKEGFSVEYDLACKSIRSQFKMAEKCNAYLAVIRGNEEIKQGKIKLKNLSERTEIEINEADLLEKIKLLFKNMNTV